MKLKHIIFLFIVFYAQLYAKTIQLPFIQAPLIDGNISGTEWADAALDSGFIQIEPDKGAASTERTLIRVGMDKTRLYVAFECDSKSPESITDGNPQRDQLTSGSSVSDLNTDDGVMLILDTFHDKRSAYLFHVNVRNTQTDIRIESNGSNLDDQWDMEWQSATQRTADGWAVEMAIPFENIKYGQLPAWGINFGRIISINQETAWWSGIMEDNFRISNAGDLVFEHPINPKKPMTWIPYFNTFHETNEDWQAEVGLDGEIPMTSDLSANITINPDFASVEGDAEVINLDPWETSYPEKRPFFRDINALFNVRYDPFYSRRIGDIQHGEKFAGKIGSVQLAGVYARTNEIDADPVSGSTYQPPAHFGVFRMQKDILSASTLGLTVTQKTQESSPDYRVINLDTKMRLPYHIYITGQLFSAIASDEAFGLYNMGGFLRMASETNTYHVHGRVTVFGDKLKRNMNSTGFLRYDDAIEFDGKFWYKHWLKNHALIKLLYYTSNYRWDWSLAQELGRYEIRQDAVMYLHNRLSLESALRYEYRDESWRKAGQTFDLKRTYQAVLGYNALEYNHSKAGYSWGQNFDGPFHKFFGGARFSLTKKLGLAYSVTFKKYDHDKADPIAKDVDLHILTTDIRFTPDLFIRIFTQYRSDKDRTYFYGRFGYRYQPPNSAIYLTYTFDDAEGRVEPYQVVFLKLSHAFRVPGLW